jgi:hypothetical protein
MTSPTLAEDRDCLLFSGVLIEDIRKRKKKSLTIDAGSYEVVIGNLKYLYDCMIASEQILVDASTAADNLPNSPFIERLARYYRSHSAEERCHAGWLRDDLQSSGVRVGPPGRLAMAMIGTQYYLLKHVHPVSLLGYLAAVEGDPTPSASLDLIERRYGKNLLRCIRYHSIKDLEHRHELLDVIDAAPAELHDLISTSAHSVLSYTAQAAAIWGMPTPSTETAYPSWIGATSVDPGWCSPSFALDK